jgi:hypothetical protein
MVGSWDMAIKALNKLVCLYKIYHKGGQGYKNVESEVANIFF